MDKLRIAATGHRPPRLGLDYTPKSNLLLKQFACLCLEAVTEKYVIEQVIVGGAQGWDTAVAEAALEFNVPFVLAVPFEGQESKWPAAAQKRYNLLRQKAMETLIVCPGGYAAWKFITRDHAMVDRAKQGTHGQLLALYDGVAKGGTYETVEYANSRNLLVWNAYPMWPNYRDGVVSP